MSSPVTQEQKDRVRRRLTFDSQDESSTLDSFKHSNNTHTPSVISTTASQTPPSGNPLRPNVPPTEPPISSPSEMTEQEKKQKMEKWNFDFENEVPLPGSWDWVAIPRPRTTDHKEVVKNLEMEKEECCSDRNV